MLDAVFSLILVISAFYLAKLVKVKTLRKQNTCLVVWHVCNLLSLVVVFAIFAMGTNNIYSHNLAETLTIFIEIYVNLFRLYLLYRFIKPR